MNNLNSRFYFLMLALVMVCLPTQLIGATIDCPVQPLTMPSSWLVRSSDGITTYQHRTGSQKLTTATYILQKAYQSGQGRKTVMQKNMDLSRATELTVNSKKLQLSAPESAISDNYQQQLFFGYDPVSERRFARLTVASGNCLQNFYYEATGQAARDFDRTANKLFNDLETSGPAIESVSIKTRQWDVSTVNTSVAVGHRPPFHRELPLAISLPGL